MTELKKNLTIPFTQGRLTQSVDFSGYVFAQFSPLNGIDALISGFSNAITQPGTLLAGITNMTETFTKDIHNRYVAGNYESIQSVPGSIAVNLTLDKVIFYKDNSVLESVFDMNYNGFIKQNAPLMIMKNMEDPQGNIKNVLFIDCWCKNETISYSLDGKTLIASKIQMECARVFAPADMRSTLLNVGSNVIQAGITNVTGKIFNLNLPI